MSPGIVLSGAKGSDYNSLSLPRFAMWRLSTVSVTVLCRVVVDTQSWYMVGTLDVESA